MCLPVQRRFLAPILGQTVTLIWHTWFSATRLLTATCLPDGLLQINRSLLCRLLLPDYLALEMLWFLLGNQLLYIWVASIPSLMLKPFRNDRSTIRRHFPGLYFLGINPTGLIWTWRPSWPGTAAILSKSTSLFRYSLTLDRILIDILPDWRSF